MPTSPIEGFCDRLDRCSARVAKVTLTHREEGSGMRTHVQLFGNSEALIDEWEDSGVENAAALQALRRRWASVEQTSEGYSRTFIVRVPRRRTGEVVRA
ncbi:MAG: hypothetical protein Q8R16_01755 [bacterium]|nr:hypothetical protein [bacterium]